MLETVRLGYGLLPQYGKKLNNMVFRDYPSFEILTIKSTKIFHHNL